MCRHSTSCVVTLTRCVYVICIWQGHRTFFKLDIGMESNEEIGVNLEINFFFLFTYVHSYTIISNLDFIIRTRNSYDQHSKSGIN